MAVRIRKVLPLTQSLAIYASLKNLVLFLNYAENRLVVKLIPAPYTSCRRTMLMALQVLLLHRWGINSNGSNRN